MYFFAFFLCCGQKLEVRGFGIGFVQQNKIANFVVAKELKTEKQQKKKL